VVRLGQPGRRARGPALRPQGGAAPRAAALPGPITGQRPCRLHCRRQKGPRTAPPSRKPSRSPRRGPRLQSWLAAGPRRPRPGIAGKICGRVHVRRQRTQADAPPPTAPAGLRPQGTAREAPAPRDYQPFPARRSGPPDVPGQSRAAGVRPQAGRMMTSVDRRPPAPELPRRHRAMRFGPDNPDNDPRGSVRPQRLAGPSAETASKSAHRQRRYHRYPSQPQKGGCVNGPQRSPSRWLNRTGPWSSLRQSVS